MKFFKIFKNKKPIIGVVHFKPLLGYKKKFSFDKVLKAARFDLEAFQDGGVDGIIFENNYDVPHKIFVEPYTIACFTSLVEKLKAKVRLPFGISVLWNDFKASLSIAKVTGASFVRIPVFVDKVETAYGQVEGRPEEVLAYQKKIEASDVDIFVDVYVKYSKILTPFPIEQAAKLAVEKGADALIVTGSWTGLAPELMKLKKVRKAVGSFPIIVGSGAKKENVGKLLEIADGVIVSTSLKSGRFISKEKQPNLKNEEARIDVERVVEFMKEVEKVRS